MPDTAGLDEIMEAEVLSIRLREEEEKGSLAMGDDNPQQNAPKNMDGCTMLNSRTSDCQ